MYKAEIMSKPLYTSFAKYPHETTGKEVVVKMEDIENYITDEKNKALIAKIIYHRYYKRYLKPFTYNSKDYLEDYKNGFSMMTNFCLLIETFSSFLDGTNKTITGTGNSTFETFFDKASKYKNGLAIFKGSRFYNDVRCGLLHQGETYGSFKIRRSGRLYDKTQKTINATAFCNALIKFLTSYQRDLESSSWDSDIWDRCRIKIRHIVRNSQN